MGQHLPPSGQQRTPSSLPPEPPQPQRQTRQQRPPAGRDQRDQDRNRRAKEPPPDQRTMPSQAHRLRRALHSPIALRQAILLREVLGAPVSLRRSDDDPPGLS